MNILLVEDNKMQLLAVASLLRNNGYNVYEAQDGIQAVELADMVKMNLVITDIFMPKMGGVSLCNYLRSQGLYTAPVILLTAASERQLEIYSGFLGDAVIVRKPVDPELLLARVANAIGQHPSGSWS